MAKRVLIFSIAYVPFTGGAELAIKEITDRFDPSEYEFDMITPRYDSALPREERVGNVTVHRIGFTAHKPKVSDRRLPPLLKLTKILFPLTSFVKALSLHRKHPYDLVWAMMANQAAFGALFFKLTHPSIPYVLELQDGNSLEQVKARRPIVRLLWPLYRAIYMKADAIKVISHFIERLAREVGYRGRIEVIPNGVDLEWFGKSVPEESRRLLKVKFNKEPGDIFLFTASRLVLSRGVEDVIQALEYLPENVKFLIAGDGEDKEKLEHIARGLGVRERVIFAGHVGHGQLPSHLSIADVFVRPSIIEGMGSAFIEAFAAGVPVVATPVGGITDFLFDPDSNPHQEPTGIFCAVRDPGSVAAAVQRYFGDSDLTLRIITNARALAQQKYDWSGIARAQRELFDTVA